MKSGWLLGLVFILSLFTSCENDDNRKCQIEFDMNTFEKEKAKWKESKIANYKYDFVYSKLGEGEKGTVEVGGNSNADYWYKTSIDDIYDYVLSSYQDMCADIEKDNTGFYAIFKFSVHVTYDPVYHYPSEIEYRYRFYEDGINGPTGYNLKINDFKIITEE